MLNVILNNPYRILGVCANSSTKEVIANKTKIGKFLQIGKSVSFPMDLSNVLPSLERDIESINKAQADLTLPNEQLKYAQFWFVKQTSFDDIALEKLSEGKLEDAINIFTKKISLSSLQNLIVSNLIKDDYFNAVRYAEQLYSSYTKEFVSIILGENATISSFNLEEDFLDILVSYYGISKILPCITLPAWKKVLIDISLQPIIDSISSAIDNAKSVSRNDAEARYYAGMKLIKDTDNFLKQLKSLNLTSDLRCQVILDKLGLEILQCGIDYYNNSDDDNSPYKALEIQKKASTIVVGSMAKGRCNENLSILKDIISKLPPQQVLAENKKIIDELTKFKTTSNNISSIIILLNNTKPILSSIKTKIGYTHSFYMKISTLVVQCALGKMIEIVNETGKLAQTSYGYVIYKDVIAQAWEATKIMDGFDKDPKFATRYNENRNTLYSMYSKINSANQSPTSNDDTNWGKINSANQFDDTNWGCIIWSIIGIIIFIITLVND